MFANGIHFSNGSAAIEQRFVDCLLVGERHAPSG
jgi:hypothetical protein